MPHPEAYSRSLACINKLSSPIKVTIDLTPSNQTHFSPRSGKVTRIIPPNQLAWVASLVIEPEASGAYFKYTFTSEILENTSE